MTSDSLFTERKYVPLSDERLTILHLNDLLTVTDLKTLNIELVKFQCIRNLDVQNFLHNQAINFEQAGKSRSYLIVTNESLQLQSSGIDIAGYFTLALKHLLIGDDISKSKQKKLNGLFLPVSNVVVGYLIGQLAKNDHFQSHITGRQLIRYALDMIQNARHYVGGRFVIVECALEEKLLSFYTENGFEIFSTIPHERMAQLVYFL